MQYFFTLLLCLAAPALHAQAPDFTITDINGQSHTLSESLAAGKVVVLDFFFVDCVPCQNVLPEIESILNDYDGTTLEVWSISDRDSDAYIEASMFAPTHAAQVVAGSEGGGAAVKDLYDAAYAFTGFPTFAVVCSDGTITWDIWPLTNNAAQIRTLLTEDCGVVESTVPVRNPTAITALRVGPNPAREQTQLQFELDRSTELTIGVYTTYGQLLISTPRRRLAAGTHTQSVDLSGFVPGYYLVELRSATGVRTLSLVVR